MLVKVNTISTTLSDEDHAAIITSIKAVEALLPFAVTMPTGQRMGLPKVGVKANEFIGKAYEYALKNPELVPQFLDMAEFGKDAVLSGQLQIMVNHMVPLLDKIMDTFVLVNAEAYNDALVFYQHVKTASRGRVPGASAVAKELAKSFKRSKTKTKPDEESSSLKTDGKEVVSPVSRDDMDDTTRTDGQAA